MKDAQPQAIYLADYQVPDFLIDKTELLFQLDPEQTRVATTLRMRRNPKSEASDAPLILNGQDMLLEQVTLNGRVLSGDEYSADDQYLTIHQPGDDFVLETVVVINPAANTSLEGLYKSRTMFCTQCEAEGFRKITYYLDRPDVLSEFVTRIEADKSEFPVLLSNGNRIDAGELEQGRHFAVWHDPFRKPAYLFALVAGTLSVVEDTFTTCSGRQVDLKIFVEEKDLDKCDHAMMSLKNSMRWDEEVYGREYDLDIFMIVAVDDFNMGAMENKGLNIFNTSCVLAKPETTTDAGFQRVEGVVAHEYFHNWSGNRVTCRDWFQLSLKEGFTVFRDAEFSADMNSATVKRVEDVSLLRTMQFAEDGGPMAHPVRPPSFIEISNFYTLTIYEKGAEVVRMIHTLLGQKTFRKGSDLYFDRHDGEAATIEDFVAAMEQASGRDLTQFKLWYSQAGTPELHVSDSYDEAAQQYRLVIEQRCPDTPEASAEEKLPMHIPVAIGLLGDAGNLAIHLQGALPDTETPDNTHRVLELTEARQEFVFNQLPEKPVPALLRGFSAPVKLHYDYSRDELMRLMSAEDDGFCRWDAAQQLAVEVIYDAMQAWRDHQEFVVDARLVQAYRSVLSDKSLDKAMVSLMLQLPSEAYLSELADSIDVEAIHFGRREVRRQIAEALKFELSEAYAENNPETVYKASAEQIAQRSLKNVCLSYLLLLDESIGINLAQQQFSQANNMTDTIAALHGLLGADPHKAQDLADQALANFYQRWQQEALVVNQWLMAQAICSLPDGVARVEKLMSHEAFDLKNPNKVRSLIGAFCNNNAINFHIESGEGYRFLADQIITLNKLNPQIAARLVTPLTKWRKYDAARQQLMKNELERIRSTEELSKDVFEVVTKSL
ncbi:aminopeptidase N [Candidatus Pelagadaptatus aseana]|uniref:aminopeptidase N n=1 Tax=Candidatus Pelagadaptatus aseana TaxID=3120508 RepID=UPI003C6EAA35